MKRASFGLTRSHSSLENCDRGDLLRGLDPHAFHATHAFVGGHVVHVRLHEEPSGKATPTIIFQDVGLKNDDALGARLGGAPAVPKKIPGSLVPR
jgi:hypothetical protein